MDSNTQLTVLFVQPSGGLTAFKSTFLATKHVHVTIWVRHVNEVDSKDAQP